MWLFLALLIVPLIEIALFIEIGGLIGLWPTIAIVILTAVIGAFLLRRQGLAALADVQGSLTGRGDPARALAHGAMILVAGIVLLTPGFFTDAIGFLLLIPAVRAAAIRFLGKRITVIHAGSARGFGAPPHHRGDPGPQTVEGEYEDVTDRAEPVSDAPAPSGARRPSGWSRGPGGR